MKSYIWHIILFFSFLTSSFAQEVWAIEAGSNHYFSMIFAFRMSLPVFLIQFISLKPAYRVVELRPGSPGELAGLGKGDIILKINGRNVYRYSLSEISRLLSSKEGKNIKLQIDRNGVKKIISFKLERI